MNPCPQRASHHNIALGRETREVIVEGIALGKHPKEIAGLLRLSPKTIAYHLASIHRSLGRNANTAGVVKLAIREGLVNA